MPSRTKTGGAACALVTLGLLAGAGQAAAQSDGVHVDPDTPAGKEYALPLDKARQDVAPNSGAQGSDGGGDTELFGAGITKQDGGGKGGGGDGAAAGGSNGEGERGSSQSPALTDTASVAKAGASTDSGISAGLLTALIALGVLVVGGAAGLSLRALRTT